MSRRSSRKTAITSYAETTDKEIEKGVIEVDEEVSSETEVKKRGGGKTAVKKESAPPPTANSKIGAAKSSKPTAGKRKSNAEAEISPPPLKRKIKDEDEDEEEEKVTEKPAKKAVKKRKTKEEAENDAMPIAVRTAVATLKRKMYIGAHISAAGGVQNSLPNALHIGANSFALFLKSQRKWTSPPLSQSSTTDFLSLSKQHSYDPSRHILPHGSYLVNLAQADPEKAEQAYTCFLDDLSRCEALGIKLYNFHPGNTGGAPRAEAIARIASMLNRAHKATKSVVTLLENMAGAGNVVGARFEDLRDVIRLIDDKSRVGVCIDTCHAFAAGYDLRTPASFAATMAEFDDVVGASYLRALHLNDSKTPLGSRRDLHANIGTGFLGLRAFWNADGEGGGGKKVGGEDRGVWAREIKLLEGMVGGEWGEGEEEVARGLQEVGRGERERCGGQVERKAQKTLDGMLKGKGKGKKKVEVETDDESEGGCSH
ncbi:DNA-(apurinic or apyrimidinic site) lyase [Pseudogymnoascus australis]